MIEVSFILQPDVAYALEQFFSGIKKGPEKVKFIRTKLFEITAASSCLMKSTVRFGFHDVRSKPTSSTSSVLAGSRPFISSTNRGTRRPFLAANYAA